MMVSFQGENRDRKSDQVTKNKINAGDSSCSSDQVEVVKLKERTETASQKHAFSERERRKRINAHYDSLRQFFPRLLKTDKASVLLETVRRLKELKDMVAAMAQLHDDGDWCSRNKLHRSLFIPGENDDVTVSYCEGGIKTTVRAIICCEDRPDLNNGLIEAIQSVRGKAVKAEMSTVGGRTKTEVVVEWPECGGGGEENIRLLRRALKAVVENRSLSRTAVLSRGLTEPEFTGLGQKLVIGARPGVYDPIETKLADGLVVRSY